MAPPRVDKLNIRTSVDSTSGVSNDVGILTLVSMVMVVT